MNYHHLLYFWNVATSGSMTAASKRLRLAPQTLSAQIRSLEESLGQPLFDRTGGRLTLTEAGRLALQYADEIFSLGTELRETLGRSGAAVRVRVGVEDTLAKLVVQRLLAPVLVGTKAATVTCVEGSKLDLTEQLIKHELDLVLTDGPIAADKLGKVRCALLDESDVAIYAVPALAQRLRTGFPRSLDGAPLLLPLETSSVRQGLESWFASLQIRPDVKAELADSALAKALASAGAGAFVAPVHVETDLVRTMGLERIAVADGVKERLFGSVPERQTRARPIVTMILERARALTDPGAFDEILSA